MKKLKLFSFIALTTSISIPSILISQSCELSQRYFSTKNSNTTPTNSYNNASDKTVDKKISEVLNINLDNLLNNHFNREDFEELKKLFAQAIDNFEVDIDEAYKSLDSNGEEEFENEDYSEEEISDTSYETNEEINEADEEEFNDVINTRWLKEAKAENFNKKNIYYGANLKWLDSNSVLVLEIKSWYSFEKIESLFEKLFVYNNVDNKNEIIQNFIDLCNLNVLLNITMTSKDENGNQVAEKLIYPNGDDYFDYVYVITKFYQFLLENKIQTSNEDLKDKLNALNETNDLEAFFPNIHFSLLKKPEEKDESNTIIREYL